MSICVKGNDIEARYNETYGCWSLDICVYFYARDVGLYLYGALYGWLILFCLFLLFVCLFIYSFIFSFLPSFLPSFLLFSVECLLCEME